MTRRKLWAGVGGILLVAGAIALVPAFRPLETPQWHQELVRQGVQFHSVPGNPKLSVCHVLLQMETGGQQWVRPALFVRNEGWSCGLSDITLHGVKDDEPFSIHFGTLTCFAPGEWGEFEYAEGEVTIPANSYTVMMSAADELPAVLGDFKRSLGEEFLPPFAPIGVTSPSLRMAVDSSEVTIDGVDWFLVSGHQLGVVPYFWMA